MCIRDSISRIRKPGGGIDYEAAEIFIGKKLRGNETIDELIAMIVKPQRVQKQQTVVLWNIIWVEVYYQMV